MVNATNVGSAKIGKYFFIDFSIIVQPLIKNHFYGHVAAPDFAKPSAFRYSLCGIGMDTAQAVSNTIPFLEELIVY